MIASGRARPQRTVHGTSASREFTEGTSTTGAFSSVRVMGDTTSGLVIPVVLTGDWYPTAGTVIRRRHPGKYYAWTETRFICNDVPPRSRLRA